MGLRAKQLIDIYYIITELPREWNSQTHKEGQYDELHSVLAVPSTKASLITSSSNWANTHALPPLSPTHIVKRVQLLDQHTLTMGTPR